jgi:hypothetical protein
VAQMWAEAADAPGMTGMRLGARLRSVETSCQCQVVAMHAHVIPGLYCGGESAMESNRHGLSLCPTQGPIVGQRPAAERPQA